MTEKPLHSSKQYFIEFFLICLLLLMVVDGGFILIPSNWQSGYVLLASLIMMADIFIFPRLKPLSDEERRIRLIWILFCIVNLCVALAFILFDFSSRITLGGMMGMLFVSSFLTSAVVFQYLRNRRIIP